MDDAVPKNVVRNMSARKRFLFLFLWLALLSVRMFAQTDSVSIVGHYVYDHSWCYSEGEDSMYCSEVGMMDYMADGTALDHAFQVYLLMRKDGSRISWTFDYYSPSFWRRQGDDFFFKGDADTFSMQLLSNIMESDTDVDADWYHSYSDEIIKGVSRGIAKETKFHIVELSESRFVWSYTYRDGHIDYWEFLRPQYSK